MDSRHYAQSMKVAILVYDGARLFDVGVALEAWRSDRLPIDVEVCTPDGRDAAVGIASIRARRGLRWLASADLVIVPGCEDPAAICAGTDPRHRAMFAALKRAHDRGAAIASMCAGAFVLGAVGLLDGRTATTHWSLVPELAQAFPGVVCDEDALFVRDGSIWTSAGTASGIDLSLELIRVYLGPTHAASTSRRLVAAPHRRGDQAQFIERPLPKAHSLQVSRSVIAAVEDDLARSWSVSELARVAHVSERTLVRRFSQEMGTTVSRWLSAQRLLEARRLLVETDHTMAEISRTVGYNSPVTFRQRFQAEVRMSPQAYRLANGVAALADRGLTLDPQG